MLTSEYLGFLLPEIRVAWQQNKQGKGENKAENNLSLNKLSAFQENGCLVCTMEAAEGSWLRLRPLWEEFHKLGLCRRTLGHSCLVVIMCNSQAIDSDCITMQQLQQVNVIHAYMISHTVLPKIVTVHNKVETKMEDGSKPKHKFTDLCREVMWLTISLKPPLDANIPVESGFNKGRSAIITYHTPTTRRQRRWSRRSNVARQGGSLVIDNKSRNTGWRWFRS